MKAFLSMLLPILFSQSLFSQPILYSQPIPNGQTIQFMGAIRDHIMLLNFDNTTPKGPQVLVMDLKMNIINIINTKKKLVPQGIYEYERSIFVSKQGINIAVSYMVNNSSIVRLATFDYNGYMINNILLDSVSVQDLDAHSLDFAYKIFQSQKDSSITFLKIVNDQPNFLLKTYYKKVYPYTKVIDSFILPLDSRTSTIIDFTSDKDDNILISKLTKKFNLNELELIKRSPGATNIFVTKKDIVSGILNPNRLSFYSYKNKYIFFGQIYVDTTQSFFIERPSKLFVWQLDSSLNDAPGFKLLHDSITSPIFSGMGAQEANNELVFFTNSTLLPQNGRFFKRSYQTTATPSPKGFYDDRVISTTLGYNIGNGVTKNTINPFDDPVDNFIRNAEQAPDSPDRLISAGKYMLNIFSVDDNNDVVWKRVFMNETNDKERSYVSNSKILSVNGKLNLIYPSILKDKKYLLYDAVFANDGSYSLKPFTAWQFKYIPDLSSGVQVTEHYFILPCQQNNKKYFARIVVN